MYQKMTSGWMKHFDFILLDIICFQASFVCIYMWRHGLQNPYAVGLYRNFAIVSALIQLFSIYSCSAYSGVLRRGYYQEFTGTLKHCAIVTLLISLYFFVTQLGGDFSRVVLIGTSALYFAAGYLLRILWKGMLTKWQKGNKGKISLILVTTRERAESNIFSIREYGHGSYCISGLILLEDTKVSSIYGISVVADKNSAISYLAKNWVDEVFLDLEESEERKRLTQLLVEMGITFHIKIARISGVSNRKQYVSKLGRNSVLTVSVTLTGKFQVFAKRALDILGGLLGFILTGILTVFLSPLIFVQSPGPIFFSQQRVGRNGKIFRIYKFRSMYMDAEERKAEFAMHNEIAGGMMFKMENDPRIIGSEKGPGRGIGNFIRRYSLDEFPQFLNVLKGEMSLVGTRPPTIDEWEKYELHHRSRLAIKPGITGLWQVSGRSNIRDFEEVVKLDTKYISEWSIGLDIRILLKTVLVMFKKDGAR